MDLLREWLAPTMTREIGAMMQLRTGAFNMSHSVEGMTYSDDGSNLRASSSKPGVVQITKFYTFEGPIKVAISDSHTFMRATIASSAAAKYAAITKKRVTKDTLGGLIQIRHFEIVATHLGARSERATILINDFESVGSEGSGGFGCPRPLESLPEIVELLNQLRTIRGRETQGSQLRSRLESPSEASFARSQFGVEGSGIDCPETSQLIFATQVPSRFSDRPLANGGEVQPEIRSIPARNKVKETNNENATADRRQTHSHPSVNAKAKANGKSSVNTPEALLRLLAPRQAVPRPVPKQNTTKKPTPAQLPNFGNISQEIQPEKPNPLASEATIGEVGSETPSDHIQDIDIQVQGSKVTSNRPLATQPTGELKSPSGTTTGSLSVPFGHSARKQHEMNRSKEMANCVVVNQLPESHKRIRSSDTRIPNDQQTLLDRADCWLPAEPGQRGPIANVPLATLQAMNRRTELTARRLSIPQDQQSQEEAADAEESVADHLFPELREVSKADSDFEKPFSSADWPPSSPFQRPSDELPPDSSMESIEYPGHRNSNDVKQSDHISPKRKLSITSMSSTTTRSTRRNPKRSSKALQGTARSSPSPTSVSADEKTKRFKCQELGCDKAYTGSSGLRYHMEHFHTAVKSNGTSKSKSRGKYGPKWYICVTCQSHFDTEEEISHHEKLDSCFTLQPGSLQGHGHPGVGIGQFTTNEQFMTNPVHGDSNVALQQGTQRDGLSSVVNRSGESLPFSPGRNYVSPYASPRLAEQLGGKSRSSSKSVSAQRVELIPGLQQGQRDGRSSVVNRSGESLPFSPGQIYVSPYASPRLAEQLDGNSRSSSKSISTQRVELTPGLPHATPPRHDTIVPHPITNRPKSVRSAASSVDSDLETTIPHALNEASGLHADSAPMQLFPSTATRPEEPFTQVKRTPYVNGHVHDKLTVHTMNNVSLLNRRTNDSSFTNPSKRTGHEAPLHPSTPGIPSTKISVDPHDYMDTADNHPAHENEKPIIVDEAMVALQNEAEVDAQSQNSRSLSPIKKQKVSAVKSMLLQSTSTSILSGPSPPKGESSVTRVQSGFELKRKSYEPSLLSPNVAKRRKHFKASTAFQFTQDVQVAQDPSILARAYRQDFLASRKGSMSEQSDLDGKTLSTPDKISELARQHNDHIIDAQYGKIVSNLEVNEMSTDIDASSSALSLLENIPPLVSKAENSSTIIGNDEDVVMTIEGRDVAVSAVSSPSEAQDSNGLGAVAGVLNDEDTDGDNTVKPAVAQECQEPDLASNSTTIETKDIQVCQTNELASSPSNIGHQQADLDLHSVGTHFRDAAKTYEEATSPGAQDGQDFPIQANASLSLGEQSALHSNRDSLLESSTIVPVVVEGDEPEGQADVLMANTEPESPTEIQDVVPLPTRPESESAATISATVFERFKTTYPDYLGNEERFVAICKKINALIQQDRMEHPSLWDDFIIRHMTEYPNYLQRCALDAEDPLPYERFYRNEIDAPNFIKRIVTPKNLREILGIGGQEDSVTPQQQQHLPHRRDSTVHMDVSPIRSVKSPTRLVSVAVSTPKSSVPQATVDLTNDSDDTEPIQSARKRPRSLPWVSSSPNGVHSPPATNRSFRNVVDSLSPPPRTSTRLKSQPSHGDIYYSPLPGSRAAFFSPPPRTSTRLKPRSGKKTFEATPKATNDNHPSPGIPKPSAATEQPKKSDPNDWWKDDNTPYKNFTKAYLSMRPGKGNAFAKSTLKDASAKGNDFAKSASKDAGANTSGRSRSSKRNCAGEGVGR